MKSHFDLIINLVTLIAVILGGYVFLDSRLDSMENRLTSIETTLKHYYTGTFITFTN
jgi:hypothetical protein